VITESRQRNGTLTIDALPRAMQMTNVLLEPKTDEDGDPIEVLSGDALAADEKTTWTLKFTSIQDWTDAAGVVNWALTNAGDTVPFVWSPAGAGTGMPSYAGNVKVRALPIGGDVNKRLTSDAEWPIVGEPTATYAV
jgi:hypothetical protein